MIKQDCIDQVRQLADVYEVVGKYVPLKRSGNGYVGLCPFHDEKSGSFRVNRTKQIYKCFGCGKSGDSIRFIMEHERKTFVEAVEILAAQFHIAIEYDQHNEPTQEQRNEKAEMLQLVNWAQKKYEDLLFSLPADAPAIEYMQGRGYSIERMKEWSLGFAPDDWKYITTPVINMGRHETGVKCGLLYSQNGKTWDFYRNRIIIPIHDLNGTVIGLAGRILPGADDAKKQVKYLNPCESSIYQKKKLWYGLWQAQKAIREAGFVYICEGYMDVQSMHDAGIVNTVASCGTEIDGLQVMLIKRYTEHAVLFYDGDKPGTDKAMKQVNLFLQHGFKVSVVQLEDGRDPDEFVREYPITNKKEVFQ